MGAVCYCVNCLPSGSCQSLAQKMVALGQWNGAGPLPLHILYELLLHQVHDQTMTP